MLPSSLGTFCATLLYRFSLVHSRDLWSVGKHVGGVDVIDASESMQSLPSGEEFFNKYMKASDGLGVPVLFKGAAKHMPAFKKWRTDEEIDRLYGKDKLDQVETEKLETRTKYPHEDWNVHKFIKNYMTKTVYSTAQTPKNMKKDVWILPPFNCGGYTKKLYTTVLWWSSGSTESVVHNDGQNNQHCMFAGSKHWILWHPRSGIDKSNMGWVHAEQEYDKGNKEFKDAYGTYVGKINIHDMDETLKKYPKWDEVKWWNMTLEPGDCAYIPPKWFHFVESPAQRSMSVHIWFHGPSKFHDKSCKALQKRGYDVKQSIFTLYDCTFGHGDEEKLGDKPTTCKLPKGQRAPQTPKSLDDNAQEGSQEL